ncbi:hypothetical protein SESBI_27571 [Sesbania bispinosa]|nr:hypothetical protein SESBI_27571 [Sesbania bispinosa]
MLSAPQNLCCELCNRQSPRRWLCVFSQYPFIFFNRVGIAQNLCCEFVAFSFSFSASKATLTTPFLATKTAPLSLFIFQGTTCEDCEGD